MAVVPDDAICVFVLFIQYPLSLFRPDLYWTNKTGVDSCTCTIGLYYLIWPLCTPFTFRRSLALSLRMMHPFVSSLTIGYAILCSVQGSPITQALKYKSQLPRRVSQLQNAFFAHSVSPSCSAAAMKREARMQDCALRRVRPPRRALCLPTAMDSLFASANYRSFFRH